MAMRTLLIVCAIFLFLAVAPLPIGYYTFLRIVVTIGSIAVIISEYRTNNEIGIWIIIFGIIAILFNPIMPIYLYQKSRWMPVDVIVGIWFLIKAMNEK